MPYLQLGDMDALDTRRDIPFPEINFRIYKDIYYVEQWLKRILFGAMLFTYGSNWRGAIPPLLRNELDIRRERTNGRIHLGCENSSNIIWLLTLEELGQLLVTPALAPVIEKTIGIAQREIKQRINELREIRNLIMHNRAATATTYTRMLQITGEINRGIIQFRKEIYGWEKINEYFNTRESDGEVNYPNTKVIQEYIKTKAMPDGRQAIFFAKEYIYEIGSCGINERTPEDIYRFVDIAKIIEKYEDIESSVLAFRLSFWGAEYSIIWTRNLEIDTHFKILDKFFSLEPEIWTDRSYQKQSPKYACDPKIWFSGWWDDEGNLKLIK